jgi:hypothetical protein
MFLVQILFQASVRLLPNGRALPMYYKAVMFEYPKRMRTQIKFKIYNRYKNR